MCKLLLKQVNSVLYICLWCRNISIFGEEQRSCYSLQLYPPTPLPRTKKGNKVGIPWRLFVYGTKHCLELRREYRGSIVTIAGHILHRPGFYPHSTHANIFSFITTRLSYKLESIFSPAISAVKCFSHMYAHIPAYRMEMQAQSFDFLIVFIAHLTRPLASNLNISCVVHHE